MLQYKNGKNQTDFNHSRHTFCDFRPLFGLAGQRAESLVLVYL